MEIKPSADIRQHYNEIADLCKRTGNPVCLTKNGKGDLIVMDIEAFSRRERMLDLREKLIQIEEARSAGQRGYSPDELDAVLTSAWQDREQALKRRRNSKEKSCRPSGLLRRCRKDIPFSMNQTSRRTSTGR